MTNNLYNRRRFIKNVVLGGIALSLPNYLFSEEIVENSESLKKLAILHTNDVHSQIESISKNDSKYPDMGGFAERSAMIKSIRAANSNVLLFDAGDIFQGTPYFNMFKGELEIKLMNEMKYDAGTIGNHEFDYGVENLKNQILKANFPFINSNYDVSSSILNNCISTHKIIIKDNIKIGVFGLGVEMAGLVDNKNFDQILYKSPLEVSNKMINLLKYDEKCDLVVCLSHLGYENKNNLVSDVILAKETTGIDLIIGGHSHTILKEGTVINNKNNNETIIVQTGSKGGNLGCVELYIDREKTGKNRKKSIIKNLNNQ
ncbi:MAG: metallophosphatase [Bacteroidota bacterium]